MTVTVVTHHTHQGEVLSPFVGDTNDILYLFTNTETDHYTQTHIDCRKVERMQRFIYRIVQRFTFK